VTAITTDIWIIKRKGKCKYRLAGIQASAQYHSLVEAMPNFQFRIYHEIRLMLDHVKAIDIE
jgi:hypothetical protein